MSNTVTLRMDPELTGLLLEAVQARAGIPRASVQDVDKAEAEGWKDLSPKIQQYMLEQRNVDRHKLQRLMALEALVKLGLEHQHEAKTCGFCCSNPKGSKVLVHENGSAICVECLAAGVLSLGKHASPEEEAASGTTE